MPTLAQVRDAIKGFVKNPLVLGIVAFLVWQLLARSTKAEGYHAENIHVKKKRGARQLLYDDKRNIWAVIDGLNIDVYNDEQRAVAAFGESMKPLSERIASLHTVSTITDPAKLAERITIKESYASTTEIDKKSHELFGRPWHVLDAAEQQEVMDFFKSIGKDVAWEHADGTMPGNVDIEHNPHSERAAPMKSKLEKLHESVTREAAPSADEMQKVMQKPYHGRKLGDKVTISSEEPLYDQAGKRMDGASGVITKLSGGGSVGIKLNDGRDVTVGVGLLKAPDSWFESARPLNEAFVESTSNEWYGDLDKMDPKTGYVDMKFRKKIWSKFKSEAERLMSKDLKIWDALGANNGNDIAAKWDKYKAMVAKEMPHGIDPYVYLILEDENHHSLNKALNENSQWGSYRALAESVSVSVKRLHESFKEARTIGPKWKAEIKRLVKVAHSHNIFHDDAVISYVVGVLPDEALDTWEGARTEIDSLVRDFNSETESVCKEFGWTDKNTGKHKMNCKSCGAETDYDATQLCHKCQPQEESVKKEGQSDLIDVITPDGYAELVQYLSGNQVLVEFPNRTRKIYQRNQIKIVRPENVRHKEGASYTPAKVNHLNVRKVFDAIIGGEVEEASDEEFFKRKPRFDEVDDVEVGDGGRSAIKLKKGGFVVVAKSIPDDAIDKYREATEQGDKYGYICMTCGKTIPGGVNKDGECPACAKREENCKEWVYAVSELTADDEHLVGRSRFKTPEEANDFAVKKLGLRSDGFKILKMAESIKKEAFKVGDRVRVAADNDNSTYNKFRKKTLIITHVDNDFDPEGGPLYSFKDEDGRPIGNSLYDWELEKESFTEASREDVLEAFLAGHTAKMPSLSTDGLKLKSYETVVAVRDGMKVTITNNRYSSTTSQQTSALAKMAEEKGFTVEYDDVESFRGKESVDVTEDEFKRFVKVQRGGKFNMLDPRARAAASLDRDTHMAIIKNYGELAKKYGTSRERIEMLHESVVTKEGVKQEYKVFDTSTEKGLKDAERYKTRLENKYDEVHTTMAGVDKVAIWGQDIPARDVQDIDDEVMSIGESVHKEWSIKQIRKIVDEHQAAKIDGVLVDAWTAQAMVTVFDALKPENQAKAQSMDLVKFANFAMKNVSMGEAAPAGMPDAMKGLWKVQYEPRAKIIEDAAKDLAADGKPEALQKWNAMSWSQKVAVIDRMQAKGRFGESAQYGVFYDGKLQQTYRTGDEARQHIKDALKDPNADRTKYKVMPITEEACKESPSPHTNIPDVKHNGKTAHIKQDPKDLWQYTVEIVDDKTGQKTISNLGIDNFDHLDDVVEDMEKGAAKEALDPDESKSIEIRGTDASVGTPDVKGIKYRQKLQLLHESEIPTANYGGEVEMEKPRFPSDKKMSDLVYDAVKKGGGLVEKESIKSELEADVRDGWKVYEFGSRLKLEKPGELPKVTKHLSDDEFRQIAHLIFGVDEKRPKTQKEAPRISDKKMSDLVYQDLKKYGGLDESEGPSPNEVSTAGTGPEVPYKNRLEALHKESGEDTLYSREYKGHTIDVRRGKGPTKLGSRNAEVYIDDQYAFTNSDADRQDSIKLAQQWIDARKRESFREELTLSASDKAVIDAFTSKRPEESSKLTTDGKTLDGLWMGGGKIAYWGGDGKIHFRDEGSRSGQTVAQAVKRNAPKNDLAEAVRKEASGEPAPKDMKCFNCGKPVKQGDTMHRWYHADQDDLVCADCASKLKHSDTAYSGMKVKEDHVTDMKVNDDRYDIRAHPMRARLGKLHGESVHSKKFRNKKTGEIVTQFDIMDIGNYEPVEESLHKEADITGKQLPKDSWGRDRIKDVKTGDIYVAVDGVWHDMTDEGEPISPLHKTVKVIHESIKPLKEGGIGKLGGDANDVLQGIVLGNKKKSTPELVALAKKDSFLKSEMDEMDVDDDELTEYIDDIKMLYHIESLKERTNDNPPKYDVGGWMLYDTSPVEKGEAQRIVDKLKASGEYADAKVSGSVVEDGKTYSYIRVKRKDGA